METIQVFFIDLPGSVKAFTIRNSDDSYTIFINAGLSHEIQCQAYDHEIDHINNHDFDRIYDFNEIERIRHSA